MVQKCDITHKHEFLVKFNHGANTIYNKTFKWKLCRTFVVLTVKAICKNIHDISSLVIQKYNHSAYDECMVTWEATAACIHTRTHTYTNTSTHVHTHMFVYIRTCMYVHARMHMCVIYALMYVSLCISVYVHYICLF